MDDLLVFGSIIGLVFVVLLVGVVTTGGELPLGSGTNLAGSATAPPSCLTVTSVNYAPKPVADGKRIAKVVFRVQNGCDEEKAVWDSKGGISILKYQFSVIVDGKRRWEYVPEQQAVKLVIGTSSGQYGPYGVYSLAPGEHAFFEYAPTLATRIPRLDADAVNELGVKPFGSAAEKKVTVKMRS